MDRVYSEWGLREAAAGKGFPVNHKQFRAYWEAGLLPAPDDVEGRWSEDDLGRLVRVREMGAKVRSLPRRVLLLRTDFTKFPVSAAKLQQAMLAVLPTIRTPMRKMNRVHRAIAWWQQRSEPFPHSAVRQRPQRPPRPEEWEPLLRSADFQRFETRIHLAYFALSSVFLSLTNGTEHDLSDIPFEEVVIFWVLLELAEARTQQAWADSLRTPPIPQHEG